MTTPFDKRRTPARPDLAAAHLAGQIDAARYVEGRRMRVIDEAIPLRSQPSPDCSLDTQALHGEEVMVYECEEGWAWGQLARDGYVGYMPADSLSAAPVVATHRVAVPRTLVYPTDNMKSPVHAALPMGALVEMRATRGDFAQIDNGMFVFAPHLAPITQHVEDYVATAELFLQVPYLWGGKTFLGLDCSGLVQIALQSAGISSPRDTDMIQAELGVDIGKEAKRQRGDLVFWKGHVGLMQDEDRLLHANGHHMQVVAESFAGARLRIAQKSFGEVVAIRRLGP